MDCFRCDREATQECARCGALYCDDHGDALCERCQDPALALPSYRVYRGSLLALLAGTVFAVWLMVRPADTVDGDAPPPAAPTVQLQAPTPTPTVAPSLPTATPTPSATAAPTPEPTTTPEPTPAAPREHIVAAGDTLSALAELYRPPGTSVGDFVDLIADLNNLDDASAIAIGQTILIPPP